MTAEGTPGAADGGASDERVRKRNWFQEALSKPSSGAIIAALVAFLVFSWPLWECLADAGACYGKGFLSARGIANWLDVAAQVGILAAAVTLLMIAGEFDLSIGSMIGAAGMIIAIGMDQFGLQPWMAVAAAFAFALAVGWFNGWLVTKTGLPSFIVTLGMLFLLRGLTIGLTRYITDRTQVGGLSDYTEGDLFSSLFTGEVTVPILEIENRSLGHLVDRADGGGRLDPVPDDLRQLDLRHRRQQGLRSQRGCACPPSRRSRCSWARLPQPPCWLPSRSSSSALPIQRAATSRSWRPSLQRSSVATC